MQEIRIPGKTEKEEGPVVISYASKDLTETQRRWSTMERESYSCVYAVEQFHIYLNTNKMISEQEKDTFCKKITEKLESNPNDKDVDYVNGLLRIKGKIIVPATRISRVINRYHSHQLASHLGAKKTIKGVMLNYTFPKLAKRVYEYIATCPICQKRKATRLTSAPLHPCKVYKHRC